MYVSCVCNCSSRSLMQLCLFSSLILESFDDEKKTEERKEMKKKDELIHKTNKQTNRAAKTATPVACEWVGAVF